MSHWDIFALGLTGAQSAGAPLEGKKGARSGSAECTQGVYNMSTCGDWDATSRRIMQRDKYTCKRCRKRYGRRRGLSVHHIRTLALGGDESDDNLITLCHECHDYVEDMGYTTRLQVVHYVGELEDLDALGDDVEQVERNVKQAGPALGAAFLGNRRFAIVDKAQEVIGTVYSEYRAKKATLDPRSSLTASQYKLWKAITDEARRQMIERGTA